MKNTFKCLLSAALVLLLALAPVGVFAAASNNDDGWTGDYIIPSIQAIERKAGSNRAAGAVGRQKRCG